MRTKPLFAALSLAMILAGAEARAAFTYSVTPVTTSTNFGAGSNLTISAANGGVTSAVLSGTQIINLAQVTQTSTTVQPATDTAIIALPPLVITITNVGSGTSGNFTLSGQINVTRSDTTAPRAFCRTRRTAR
ncbi:MAG: hypothetical protein U0835_16305 [Isosphaeraceae bacterium]